MFTCCVTTFHKSTLSASSFTASDTTLQSSCKVSSSPPELVHTHKSYLLQTSQQTVFFIQHGPRCLHILWVRITMISSKHFSNVKDTLQQMWLLLQHKTALTISSLLLWCFLLDKRLSLQCMWYHNLRYCVELCVKHKNDTQYNSKHY